MPARKKSNARSAKSGPATNELSSQLESLSQSLGSAVNQQKSWRGELERLAHRIEELESENEEMRGHADERKSVAPKCRVSH